jgi:SPP1 family predicted phage head-tail adaptor
MRAGLLRDVVVFKEPRQVRTDTGGVRPEYVEVLRCRAYKRRFSNVTDKDKIEAHKEFYGHFGVFQVRYHPRIREDQILEYRGVKYKIILLDLQYDNTYLVNVNKMNE